MFDDKPNNKVRNNEGAPGDPSRRNLLRAGMGLATGAALGAGLMGGRAFASSGDSGAKRAAIPQETQVVEATGPISRYLAEAGQAGLPKEVEKLARMHILDTLASVVACRDLEPSIMARRYVAALGHGGAKQQASILGTHEKAPLIDAAFASAMTAHGAEINDFIPSALVQPGPAVLATAMAIGEAQGRSGRTLLNAVVAGYELAGRIPKTLGVHNMQKSPLACHGVGSVFASGATAAVMLGLNPEQAAGTMGLCIQQASGSWQWLMDTRHIEKAFVFAGMGARNGIQAALMAQAGFEGVPDCMDIPWGFMHASDFRGGDADQNYLVEKLGERFELSEAAFKQYPVGGPTQPAVRALLDMLDEIQVDSVEAVTIEMPGRASLFQNAKMPALNLPYITASLLLDGRLDFVQIQSRERMTGNSEIASLMKKVKVISDPRQEAPAGEARRESARVTVRMRGREPISGFVHHVPGFPSHPMNEKQVEHKARELMGPSLGGKRADQVVSWVASLQDRKNLGELARLIAS